ncbi:hypothetical protein B7486_49685 [cyanobacterium TDX16]|nr:hypothetical protein B7486_49685 [cyanobacterium TDX16]
MAAISSREVFAWAHKPPVMKYWQYDRRTRTLRYVKTNQDVELEQLADWLELVDWIFYLHHQGLEPAALDEFISFCGWYFLS